MYVLTTELAAVLNEFIIRYDKLSGRSTSNWQDKDAVKKLSGREYVALKSNMDTRQVYKILNSTSTTTDFSTADRILCGIEMQEEFHLRVTVYPGTAPGVGGSGGRTGPAYTRMCEG